MREWSVFLPDVLPDVMGCPEPTIERHLLRAARDFCTRTLCWRADLDPITTVAATASYDLEPPAASEVFKIIDATLNGSDIDMEAMTETNAAARIAGNSGRTRLLSWDPRSVTVMPTPSAGLPLIVTVLLRPSNTAAGIPDFMDQHLQILANGALSTLLTINGASWANPGLAAIKRGDYEAERFRVQKAVWKAFSNRNPRTRAMYF